MVSSSKITAIISEYNPFHYGHAFHIQETRKRGSTHIIAVMSGDFVQRGSPALASKWARTEMALRSGVDLVVELPLPWAMATAQKFAFGAVSLIEDMGCVDSLSFGSECGDIDLLNQAACQIDSPLLNWEAKKFLQQGMTYAKAKTLAVQKYLGNDLASLLASPNNTLGIEYLRSIHQLNSHIVPFTIPRIGVSHDASGNSGMYASASHIRSLITSGLFSEAKAYLPFPCQAILQREQDAGKLPAQLSHLERVILYQLRNMTTEQIASLPDITEGLEHRIANMIATSCSLEELFGSIKTKRYTHARIRRIILSSYLGIFNDNIPAKPLYLRILGFGSKGKDILKTLKQSSVLPIITRARDARNLSKEAYHLWQLECKASDLFGLATPMIQPCGTNQQTEIIQAEKI